MMESKTPVSMLIAIVQAQDAEVAHAALVKKGLNVDQLPSVGAFLGRRNATLVIGVPPGQEEPILNILHANCRERIEYISVPLESAPLPLPTPTAITVGGATIFRLDIEHYEEV